MKTRIPKILLLILLLFRTTTAFAVWYQVEMVVFENLYSDTDGENWYQAPGLVPLANAVNLLDFHEIRKLLDEQEDESRSTGEAPLVAYGILPEANNRLDDVDRILRLSREYRPLYHVSWQQPGLEQNRSIPVHVQAEDNQNLFPVTIPPELILDGVPVDFYEPIKLAFDGTVQIRSSLYLHVDLDMVLFRAPPMEKLESAGEMNIPAEEVQEPLNEPVDYVRMTESRRIKLNELHYFDHPLFGVILQVSRFGP